MADSVKVRSYAKGVDLAPRKVSIVASLVRNRTVADALVILEHVPRRSALPIKKAIESAKANAVNNHGLDGKTLVISDHVSYCWQPIEAFQAAYARHGIAVPEEDLKHLGGGDGC